MRVSKYIKLDTNILMEYVYDDANLIGEPYNVLINIKNSNKSFLSTSTSGSLNVLNNQLFQIDPITRIYGKSNITDYAFLQVNNYASGYPIRYDNIIIRMPINYTFGENIGFYLRVYSFDSQNNKTVDLSNFYFDITDVATKNYIEYTSPPILYQEKLWGKEIKLVIPSLYTLSNQRRNNSVIANSINYNLTEGIGLNLQSPIFFEFSFINSKKTTNSVTTYKLATNLQSSLPQIPEFEKLGVKIQHSANGDFFEIYGIYNNNVADFKTFIDNSVYLGNRYYIQYNITLYEQNLRGKTLTVTVTDNFNDTIEYRPIIKSATTTAVIDIEMYLIDAVDNSQILRKASYGMLHDEVSKYSRILTKINLTTANRPKIYNQKTSLSNFQQNSATITNIQSVNVPYTLLSNMYNIVAKSDSVINGNTTFFGDGKLVILLKPFDNILKLTIASEVLTQNNTITPKYIDMTGMGQIQLVFKNSQISSFFNIFENNGDVDLGNGTVVFKISANKISDIRTIYNSGINIFYLTSTLQNTTTVIYSGLFKMYDSMSNVNDMNLTANQLNLNSNTNVQSDIILDNSNAKGTAIVTRVIKQDIKVDNTQQQTQNQNIQNNNSSAL